MIKKLWGLCSIYILMTTLNSKGGFYSDQQWAYLNIEEIFIVIHRKLYFFPLDYISFFLNHPRLKKQVWSVKMSCNIWHFEIYFLIVFIQRIAWLPLNSYDASLHIKQSYTFLYTMLVWDLDYKQKLNGEVNALYRLDRAIYSLFLVAFVPPTPFLVGFLEIAAKVREDTYTALRNGLLNCFCLYELYLSKPKFDLKRYLYYG